jgi:23S rRNA A1618 N6-methylase RlmF
MMCNPPFYSSHAEIQQPQLAKEELPLQACSESENEMIYPGDSEAAGIDLTHSG